MSAIIALAQCGSTGNIEQNLQTASRFMQAANEADASLIVFPEYFMMPYTAPNHQYVTKAQRLDGPFVSRMKQLSKENHLWTIFGISESPSPEQGNSAGKCFNTLVVLDDTGNYRGHYRKTHLFDAFNWKESADTLPGREYFFPINTPAGKLGLGTCFDLRFPDVARRQALQGAQVLIYPSAWVKGELKDVHWTTLLRARAIENGMYVIGCSQFTPDTYLGKSCAFDPMGRLLTEGGYKEEILFVSVSPEESDKARQMIPSLSPERD